MEFTRKELKILNDIMLTSIQAIADYDKRIAARIKDDKLPDEVPVMIDVDIEGSYLKSIHDKIYAKIHY